MKKILFVGEHPLGVAGNSHMMAAILSQVDTEKYQISCFVSGQPNMARMAFQPFPFTVINAEEENDRWGQNKLLRLLSQLDFDILCMVGLDIWRYAQIFVKIDTLRKHKGFKWAFIFPYDLQQIREDWLGLIRMFDFPCVYSQYGKNMLQGYIPNIKYFRPLLFQSEIFKRFSPDERKKARTDCFPNISQDQFIFGYVGINQVRKDPQRLIKAFFQAKKECPEIVLYLHTGMESGVFNLKQISIDYGATTGDLLTKRENAVYPTEEMVKIYNTMDCLVNCSMQEGLSWTVLEAMLCGVPVIGSDTTAQTEIIKNAGLMVPCQELSYVPLNSEAGRTWIDAKACKVKDIKNAMVKVASDKNLRQKMSADGLRKAQNWLAGVSDINEVLKEATEPVKSRSIAIPKINKILFMQHSSAGDVLMTTQCFKGIKKKHPGMKFVFMTPKQYQDIVEGNPYLDEIVDWDEIASKRYTVIYNPHGEKILRGGWNNLDIRLHDMYSYFCEVKRDKIYVEQVNPELPNLPKDYIVVHSTGGQIEYRCYKHIDMATKNLPFPLVQIGGSLDLVCRNAKLDLRTKLSFRESAWVMAHAKAAICIDSFVSHLAGAVGTPAIVLFGPAPSRVTGPRNDAGNIICIGPEMLKVCPILSHCWGQPPPGKHKCTSPCINSINPQKVRKALLELLEKKRLKCG